jgi:divalent metal cation (Fe/Co/Zn/Cd) transporter
VRVEAIILLFLGVFFGIVGIVYWFWSYEDAGSVMLVGTSALGFLPGAYYFFWHRRMGKRVEDREDASIAEGAGEINSFPGSSIWPFVMGMGAFLTLLSLVFGIWLILPGITLIVSALIGVTAESRRGGHV